MITHCRFSLFIHRLEIWYEFFSCIGDVRIRKFHKNQLKREEKSAKKVNCGGVKDKTLPFLYNNSYRIEIWHKYFPSGIDIRSQGRVHKKQLQISIIL